MFLSINHSSTVLELSRCRVEVLNVVMDLTTVLVCGMLSLAFQAFVPNDMLP